MSCWDTALETHARMRLSESTRPLFRIEFATIPRMANHGVHEVTAAENLTRNVLYWHEVCVTEVETHTLQLHGELELEAGTTPGES